MAKVVVLENRSYDYESVRSNIFMMLEKLGARELIKKDMRVFSQGEPVVKKIA